jgi:hypothetical protein
LAIAVVAAVASASMACTALLGAEPPIELGEPGAVDGSVPADSDDRASSDATSSSDVAPEGSSDLATADASAGESAEVVASSGPDATDERALPSDSAAAEDADASGEVAIPIECKNATDCPAGDECCAREDAPGLCAPTCGDGGRVACISSLDCPSGEVCGGPPSFSSCGPVEAGAPDAACIPGSTDPLNACSPYAAACVYFDDTAHGVPNPLPPLP